MKLLRTICAVLLALPLIVFGSNYFVGFFEIPPGDGGRGDQLLQAMRDGGLMVAVALSHVVIGVLLVIPRTRFTGGLLQLPITIGMLAFHVTMLPAGIAMAAIMLALNLGAIAEPKRIRLVMGKGADK